MHEMSLCESVLQLIERNAARHHFARVTLVTLEIGELAGVDVEAMRFGFEAVTRGTLAAEAELQIVQTPGRAWCMPCGEEVYVNNRLAPCPACGSHQLQVTGGEDMLLKQLEVE